MNRYEKNDYEVGKGKPPKSGQIRPGEVRNPHGRGRAPDRATLYNSIAETEVTLTGDRRGEKTTLRALGYHQILSGAAKGNPKFCAPFLRLESELGPNDIDTSSLSERSITEIIDDLHGIFGSHKGER